MGVIRDYYSNYCNGWFEKDLTVKINWPNSKYEYDSDNGYCSIFVDVDEYGAYKRWSRDNGAYVSSWDLSQ